MTLDPNDVLRLLQGGRHDELEVLARAAIGADPGSGLAWKALSVALSAQRKDPLAAMAEAARLLPQDAEAHTNLAHAQRTPGELAAAIASYTRAVNLAPADAVLHHNLGNALLARGEPGRAAASYAAAVALQPELAAAHCNLGNALRQLGRPAEALASLERALQLEPRLAVAYANRGDVLRDLGLAEEAAASCRQAVTLAPTMAGAHNSLGNALLDLGSAEAAVGSYRQALALQPQFPGAEVNLALALRQLGEPAAAEAVCRDLLVRLPCSAEALVTLAELAGDRGEFASAEALLCRATAADPQSVEGLAGIAYLRRMTPADAPWAAAALHLATRTTPRREVHLRFALGKYHDDVGNHSAAFNHFQRAHELLSDLAPGYDQRRVSALVDQLIATQGREWLQHAQGAAGSAPRPVFVLGMPRSGTSLAEQILASHPDVFGAGELGYWGAVAAHPVGPDLAALGRRYRGQLTAASRGARCVIDKMPANFWHIGLIRAALPDARIIHLSRDPRDTCLSIYCTNFRSVLGYSHDLADLAHYYREYQRLMRHWRAVLPDGVMLDVPYEGLVADTDSWCRRIVGFAGLSWDSRCLDFHRNERRVLTSSKWQVRQKISGGSIGRWRRYEPVLGPLLSLRPDQP